MGEPARVAIQEVNGGVRLRVKVLPGAASTEVLDVQGDLLRIRLAAPPVDGAANEALVRLLAGLVSVPKSAVQILSGERARAKQILIKGTSLEQVRSSLGL